ncbi:hypothetical protein C8R47DRAFT_430404 [Mycena vitilis]|nr:hypothetical protein C8R47DRAFT_430404 [Mycena vitilis]
MYGPWALGDVRFGDYSASIVLFAPSFLYFFPFSVRARLRASIGDYHRLPERSGRSVAQQARCLSYISRGAGAGAGACVGDEGRGITLPDRRAATPCAIRPSIECGRGFFGGVPFYTCFLVLFPFFFLPSPLYPLPSRPQPPLLPQVPRFLPAPSPCLYMRRIRGGGDCNCAGGAVILSLRSFIRA